MSKSPPAFLSFPEFVDLGNGSKGESSKAKAQALLTSAPSPSFSSFPDIILGSTSLKHSKSNKEKDRHKHHYDISRRHYSERGGGRDKESDRRRTSSPEMDEERRSDKDKERRRENHRTRQKDRERDKYKLRDNGSDKDKDRDDRSSRRKDDSRSSRHDRDVDRHRTRDKDRDRSKEKDRDEDEREARRRDKERRREREREEAEALARGEKRAKLERFVQKDDGVPWYDTTPKLEVYREDRERESFDPKSDKVSFVDTVGDKDAVRYGLKTSHSAPRYRRDDVRVLGLHDGLRVVYSRERLDKGIEIAPAGKPFIPRHLYRPESKQHLRILLRPSQTPLPSLSSSFIPFDPISRSKPTDTLPAYRQISHSSSCKEYDEGIPQDSGEQEDEIETLLRSIGPASTVETQVRSQTVEFEKHLKAHPDDVPSWIKYSTLHLRLSEDLTSLNPSSKFQTAASNSAATRAEAEVTLSILARALDAHEGNFGSPELHLAYLAAAESFWPTGKVTERWRNVLRELGGDDGDNGRRRRASEEGMIKLWLGYIEWREGQGFGSVSNEITENINKGSRGGGGVDEVVDVYIECLEKLAADKIISNHEAREENLVYVFLRACLFLRQAGYAERALATFQALIEITFFKPPHLRQPAPPFDRAAWFAGVLAEFEDHWDSESPRIGEPGARGWAQTRASTDTPSNPSSVSPQLPTTTTTDPFSRWYNSEISASSTYSHPGRASDLEAPDDDPFHVILFTDLSPFLFPISTPTARLQLIYAFLNFLGLPFGPPDISTSAPATTDAHLCWALGENGTLRERFWPVKERRRVAWTTVGGEPMGRDEGRVLKDPFGGPVKSWVSERGTLLAKSGKWFRDLDAMDLEHVDVPFARNALAMLRPLIPDPTFVLRTFAFEAALSIKSAVKLAKTVLFTDRNNFALWDGYARLERQRGNLSAARQVYVTALQAVHEHRQSQSDKNVDDIDLDEGELWASWVEMEWEEDEARCLNVLLMAAGIGRENMGDIVLPEYKPRPSTPVMMLKARQHYASPLLPLTYSRRALAATFIALTESIESSRNLLLDLISLLPLSHPQAEETYQLLIRLIHIHTARHPDHLASLPREVLEKAILAFPNNTAFLSMYLFGEVGGRVYGRVGKLVDRLTREKLVEDGEGRDGEVEVGVGALMWAVWAESVSASRTFWDGGAERVRRVLDRGINSRNGKHSVALWKLYIEFEVGQGRHTVAKSLVYRAINSIGGCKDLYLLPFTPLLREQFTPRELSDMVSLMDERGIRVRVPTEGFWDERDLDAEEEEEHEELDDDEYGFLRDREVAKPY